MIEDVVDSESLKFGCPSRNGCRMYKGPKLSKGYTNKICKVRQVARSADPRRLLNRKGRGGRVSHSFPPSKDEMSEGAGGKASHWAMSSKDEGSEGSRGKESRSFPDSLYGRSEGTGGSGASERSEIE